MLTLSTISLSLIHSIFPFLVVSSAGESCALSVFLYREGPFGFCWDALVLYYIHSLRHRLYYSVIVRKRNHVIGLPKA